MKNIDEELVCFFNSNDFQRKSKIVNFLKEKKDWGKKKAKAEILLRSIADQFGKGQIYTELIKNNLRIYEDAVKKTLPTHRDHFVHSAYVYLLGVYIFNKDSDYQQQVESNFNSNQPLTKKNGFDWRKEFEFRWTITSIFHDLAYPIEILAKQINDYQSKIDRRNKSKEEKSIGFDLFNFEEMISFEYLQPLDPLLQQQHFKMRETSQYIYADNVFDILACNFQFKFLNYGYETIHKILADKFLKKVKSGEIDHGIMGSVILANWVHDLYLNNKWDSEVFYCSIGDCLGAIALHTCQLWLPDLFKRKIVMAKHPLAYLLVLCDELQDWQRPSGEEILASSNFMDSTRYFKLAWKDKKIFINYRDKQKTRKKIEDLKKRIDPIKVEESKA